MNNISIPIEKDFYDLVEQPGYLKHVIYGDSVCEDHYIQCLIGDNEIPDVFSLKNLWNYFLENNYNVEVIDGNEYIFNLDNFKIINYNIKTKEFFFTQPKYFMRHYYNGPISSITLSNGVTIKTTRAHSFVHIEDDHFVEKKPFEIDHVLWYNRIQNQLDQEPVYDKDEIEYDGFVYDFEIPDTHIFIIDDVLVHNTDSLFIEIPSKPDNILDKVKLVNETAKNINELIERCTKEYILPRCGFSPERNETNFKEEMIIDRMIMLDIKKSYAYGQIAAEAYVDPETNELKSGTIYETPIIEKKSGLGVKGDTIDLTKKILDFLITLALDISVDPKDKYNTAMIELKQFYSTFKNSLENLDVTKIGTPVRWQKKINVLNAMNLYNCIVQKDFQFLSTGNLLYCKFNSMIALKDFEDQLPLEKLNAIAFPIKFDPEKVKEAMIKYNITFDVEKQWNTILNKTCHRLLESLKNESKK